MANDENSTSTKLPKLKDDGTNNNYGEWEFKAYHALLDWDLLKYIEDEPPEIPPSKRPSFTMVLTTTTKLAQSAHPAIVPYTKQPLLTLALG